ncbi:unnamed protein product [Lampetra fluviatilis]
MLSGTGQRPARHGAGLDPRWPNGIYQVVRKPRERREWTARPDAVTHAVTWPLRERAASNGAPRSPSRHSATA